MRYLVLLLSISSVFGLSACRENRIHQHPEWKAYFEKEGITQAGFMLRDHTHDAVHYYNLERDTMHLSPASTFKIFLSLVALETGVVQSDKFIIPWDGSMPENTKWSHDMDLREAFETSSEPYFKEVARRIGKERLQHYLDSVNYGNKTIGDSVSTCWTDNSLRISADEQVGFIRRLYFDQLPFSDRTQRIVRSLMLRHDTQGKNRKMYYKTGWVGHGENNLLWVVGFAEDVVHLQEEKGSMNKSAERNYVYFFAQQFEIPRTDTGKDWAGKRIDILNSILNDYTKGKTGNE